MDHTALDFLAENCIAGQTLLRMVARANAIIAELLRLRLPLCFQNITKVNGFEILINS